MTANATVIDRTRTPSSPLQVLSKERFSRNPEVNETILWLREQGYPALPIAPLVPVPKGKKLRFSGKNPSWLSRWGQPCLLDHKLYQERLPTDDELKQWFSHVDTGIATMGGWNSTLWIDIDAKRFNSVEECQRVFQDYLRDTRLNTFTETTQSGGWRLGVKLKEMPEFSKFSFRPQGKLVGELIGSGMIAVLAPTIGTVGTYRSISRIPPVEIESLEQIGLYPYRKVSQSNVAPQPLFTRSTGQCSQGQGQGIEFERLACQRVLGYLNELDRIAQGNRSDALTAIAREVWGWQNWLQDRGYRLAVDPEAYLMNIGSRLGIEGDRVNRILNSHSYGRAVQVSMPSLWMHGGDRACQAWLKQVV
jgi:hypothetical protein